MVDVSFFLCFPYLLACALSIDSDNISWAYLLEAAHNNYMYGYSARYLLTQTERFVAVAVC